MNRTQAIQIGKRLGDKGLVEGASGNISFRKGNKITITKAGTVLDDLNEESFVTVNLEGRREEASSDHIVHQAIYKNTDFNAIVHCHGVFNVVISLVEDKISPADFEGKQFLKEVPVVDGEFRSQENAEIIATTIKEIELVVLRGHGIYSASHSLHEALNNIEYLEHSCEILYRSKVMEQ